MTPYTTKSGVKIGLRYQSPPPRMSRDEEIIQSALLGRGSSSQHLRPWVVIALLVVTYALVSCIRI